MTVIETSVPTNDEQQLANHNSNIGGGFKITNEFEIAADKHYAIVALLLEAGATAANIESTLLPAITALPEVVAVRGDQAFGQTDATVPSNTETVIHVRVNVISQIGPSGDTFESSERKFESITPPADTKFLVMTVQTPTAMDAAAITALEVALVGITGITSAEHLICGSIVSLTFGTATVKTESHIRVDGIVA